MTRIRVIAPRFEGSWFGKEYNDAEVIQEGRFAGQWYVDNKRAIFTNDEVRVLGRHEGEYDPNHWGELDPDAYDRQGFRSDYPHGRHLLHTGTE